MPSGLVKPLWQPYGALAGRALGSAVWCDCIVDQGFPAAAFEDTESGYRWQRKSRMVLYSERAVCRHRHHYESIEPFLIRQRRAGRAARYALALHPAMMGRTVLQPLAAEILLAARYGLRRISEAPPETDLWDLRVRTAFSQGLFGS